MSAIWNFSPGPAMLPPPVLGRIAAELEDWNGTGVSVMEISHRSSEFEALAARCERDLRELLAVPDSHQVLFLQGGATNQFALAPLNFCRPDEVGCYAVLGHWGAKAERVAATVCRTALLEGTLDPEGRPAPVGSWPKPPPAAYLHYVINETIDGLVMDAIPAAGAAALVCDASSWLLSEPVVVDRFGLLYASAQKNLGPAGLTVVIVARDLLGRSGRALPVTMDYRVLAETGSMENTPPTFAWYVTALVLEWLKDSGGVVAIERINRAKAKRLYDLIDSSDLYQNTIAPCHRSRMNVVFRLRRPELTDEFLREAGARGLVGLKGHRAVGGLRASIYNAMPLAGVEALAGFMQDFEQRH